MTARRDERRTAAREGILAAAHRQLAEGGCASASVTAIAARAGVAAGSLYRHFPSRAELLAEVVGDALRAERVLLAAATDGLASREGLAAWVRLSVERSLRSPTLTAALLAEPSEPAVEAVRLREQRAQEGTLAALLTAGARAGAWPHADAPGQAAAITGALRAALVGPAAAERLGARAAAERPGPDAATEADALTDFVLGAVRAR